MRTFITVIIALLATQLHAQTTVSGDIGGRTFEPSGNPYIVADNLEIPANSAATIKAGCVFLFKQFTGINVHGSLTIAGTKDNPVVLTSIHNGTYNPTAEQMPNPFDWNGIFVAPEAGTVTFSNFILSFSVFGIKSQEESIVVESGLFRQNGQYHFTIKDAIQLVQDDFPYSYNTGKAAARKSKSGVVRPLPAIALGSGAAGLIAGGLSMFYWSEYRSAWQEADTAIDANIIAEATDREEQALVTAATLTGIAAVLVPTAAVLSFLDRKRQRSGESVSLYPVVGPHGTGMKLLCRF